MHNQVTVLGTIDADLQRIIDTDHDATVFRWMSFVGILTGDARKIGGQGRNVKAVLDAIADSGQDDAAEFVKTNGGAVIIAGLAM